MSVREILKMGDPRLLRQALPVTNFGSVALNELITDMFDTMHAANGAGLAAPQIGVNLRVVIFGFRQNSRYPDAEPVPETVLINPQLRQIGTDLDMDWEGCLSVPGMRGMVPRWSRVHYTGVDQNELAINREVEGFHARVVQHEVDHLDGVLYPRRITDLTQFGFIDALFPDSELAHSEDD